MKEPKSQKTTVHASADTYQKVLEIEDYLSRQSFNIGNVNRSSAYRVMVDTFYELFVQNEEQDFQHRRQKLLDANFDLPKAAYSKIVSGTVGTDANTYLLLTVIELLTNPTAQTNFDPHQALNQSPEVAELYQLIFRQIKKDQAKGKTIKHSHGGQ
ncbi:hypothetical protein LMC02_09790 [Limosilactobacillus reuteri]|uniref:hypothetical protein n=1 Tax=Limosilactobacillus reuteri TaxID=1598 RepID=UPI001E32E97E|nr:hypothetical protein [Limosilactobacillus reuteri]MCC4500278.1 hypothetical protein [Limosilactobacillus reuteri]MCC4500603.1 hypothetical protein [Limosilactobacillus reuteri]